MQHLKVAWVEVEDRHHRTWAKAAVVVEEELGLRQQPVLSGLRRQPVSV